MSLDPRRLALTRRALLARLAALVPLPWLVAACRTGPNAPDAAATDPGGAATGGAPSAATDAASSPPAEGAAAARAPLAPTPACGDDDEPTPPQGAGPFYTPDTPERASLREAGMAGTPLVVSGRVLDTACRPVGGALLDFWHADDAGAYDNVGYRLRGHQFADAQGRWRLETVLPGIYPGRTRHIHVRVQPPGGAVLTTQLYFPKEPANATDGIYRPELELTMAGDGAGDGAGERSGTFDFVLAAG